MLTFLTQDSGISVFKNESLVCLKTGRASDTRQPLGSSPGLAGKAFGFPGCGGLCMVISLKPVLLFSGFPLIKEIFLLQGCHC